jgi:hypothetical protein
MAKATHSRIAAAHRAKATTRIAKATGCSECNPLLCEGALPREDDPPHRKGAPCENTSRIPKAPHCS